MTNNQILKKWMREYGISHKLISKITHTPLWKVNLWCVSPESERHLELNDFDMTPITNLITYIRRHDNDYSV